MTAPRGGHADGLTDDQPGKSWRSGDHDHLAVDTVTLGRGFKALRLRKRLRQDDLGAQAGVSRGAIARIERIRQ